MKSKKIIAFVCALVMAGTGVPFNYGYNYNENSIVSVKAGGYGDYQGNQVVSGDFSYNLNENGEAVILGYRGDKSEVTTAEIKETDKPVTTSMLNADKTSAVSLGSVSGKVGDTVIVPLCIMNNPGIISIQADISFDLTALKLKEVKKNGEFWASADIMSSRDLTAQPYRITCSDVLAKSDFTEDGTLCEISFEIIKEGTHKVELNISDAKNYDLAKVKLESVSGLVGTSSETVTTTPVSVTETLATTPVSATETLVTTLVSVAETSVTTTPVSVTEAPVSTTAVSTTEKNDNPPSENIKSGKLSETITWKLDDNGTLVISGSGDIPDYKIMESPFYELDDIKNVVFEEGITGIGDCLFYENKYIRNITLSNTIEKIGFMAFDYCKGIESVEFPNSIRIIGGSAFLGCDSLERISLNEGIERIDGLAFAFCPKIKYVIIPDSIKTLGSYVFSHCDGLEMISVPETLGEVTNLPDNTVVKVRKPGELPETGTVNGDADGNGVVNTADIIYVAQAIISGAFSADINGDGVTDAKDYAEIRRLFLK